MTNKPMDQQTRKPATQLTDVGATFRSPATRMSAPPTEVGGSQQQSRALQCAGFGSAGVAVRMAVLYLLARGKP